MLSPSPCSHRHVWRRRRDTCKTLYTVRAATGDDEFHGPPPPPPSLTRNHVFHESRYLKLSFHSVADLMEVKRALMPTIQANKTRAESMDAYMHTEAQEQQQQQPDDFLSVLVDAREYDVPYYVRCSIDLDIRRV